MFALYLKELRSFLSSVTGYVVITVFLVTIGLFLWFFPNEFNVLDYGYANLDGLFGNAVPGSEQQQTLDAYKNRQADLG